MKWNWQRVGDRIDIIDADLCRRGFLSPANWDAVLKQKVQRLYAGKLNWCLPQYATSFGLTLDTPPSRKNIVHDIRQSIPLPDGSIDVYQAEDVFEHVSYDDIPGIFNEIFRILKPGGLFRLSVPDYRSDLMRQRTLFDDAGAPLFDPDGGGQFVAGQIVGGGHLWFPDFGSVKALFERSRFSAGADVDFLHYTADNGSFVLKNIDYSKGFIRRTPDHDPRAAGRPLSIVVDAIKR